MAYLYHTISGATFIESLLFPHLSSPGIKSVVYSVARKVLSPGSEVLFI